MMMYEFESTNGLFSSPFRQLERMSRFLELLKYNFNTVTRLSETNILTFTFKYSKIQIFM